MIGISRGIGLGLGVARAGGAALWYLAGGAPLPVAAYQPIGAASLAASYTNLANPGTYNAALGVAPTWASATGWTFNGSTQWLSTNIKPQNNQSWSMLIRVDYWLAVGGWTFLAGFYWNDYMSFGFMAYQNVNVFFHNGGAYIKAGMFSQGVFAIAGNKAYLNGVEAGTIPAYAGTWDRKIAIGASFGGARPSAQSTYALAIYNSTLTAAQVLAVTNAMNALTG